MGFGVASRCSDTPPSFPAGHRVDGAGRVHQVQLSSVQAPAVSVSLGIIPHRAPGSDLPGPWAFPKRHVGLGWTPDPQIEGTDDEVGTGMLQYPPVPKNSAVGWGSRRPPQLFVCLPQEGFTHAWTGQGGFPRLALGSDRCVPSPAASCPPDVTTSSCSTSRMTGARTTWKLG